MNGCSLPKRHYPSLNLSSLSSTSLSRYPSRHIVKIGVTLGVTLSR